MGGSWLVCDKYEIREIADGASYNLDAGLYSNHTLQMWGDPVPRPANLYGQGLFPAPVVNMYSKRGYLFRCLVGKYLPTHAEDELHKKWREYEPTKEVPDLFLRFARLYRPEQDYSDNQILDWVERYGLLGVDGFARHMRGGDLHSMADFVWQVYWAAGILAMYEAVLNGDKESAKRAVLEEFVYVAPITYMTQVCI